MPVGDTQIVCIVLCLDFLTKEAPEVNDVPNEDPLHMFSAKFRKVHREWTAEWMIIRNEWMSECWNWQADVAGCFKAMTVSSTV